MSIKTKGSFSFAYTPSSNYRSSYINKENGIGIKISTNNGGAVLAHKKLKNDK